MTDEAYPLGILRAVDRGRRERPADTAVQASDTTLDFVGLAERSEQLAALLAAHGVREHSPVGLLLGRTADSVAALLAVWRLGATAVPLDPGHPVERLAYALRDAGVRTLLAPQVPQELDMDGIELVRPVQAVPIAAPVAPVIPHPEACSYIIYTSGTTGRPKGVEVTYRGLDTFTDALGTLGLAPGGLGLNAVSPAFDGWLWCTLLYLLHGQGVALADLSLEGLRSADGDASPLPPGLRTVSLTPSLLAAHGDGLDAAEVVVVAGEACPPALAERFAAGRRFLNVYGPTEATIAATWADSAQQDDVRTIGRPLPGYRAYVLDARLRLVARGEEGELFLGGPALARGYRNQPGLTSARFVPDPFAGGGARMYRTGDLVALRADGTLEYRGRRDDQVKIRGHRVELGEVDRVAAAVPGVEAAAAYVTGSGDTLGLAVVAAPGAGEVSTAVLARCADLLPTAAVPHTVRTVPVLPTLATGKADRAALARDLADAAQVVDAPAADLTDRERQVLQLWNELLDREITDPDADFFALGGHSLLAARAVAELRRRTGGRVTLAQLLAHPTAAGLAAELDRTLSADAGAPAAGPVTGGVR
ncbi:non-ribosomal peptide synthetase [Streptomyces sp. NPDC001339]|uniref:non-ribosomal peptide synthetase n=1 Tax=Streptomyces sp. NPDC001339 TaxID=3364563 RepID=UPI003683F89F